MALQSKSEGQYEPLAPDLDVGPLQAADRTGGLSKNHLALLLLIAALSLMVVEALTAYQVLEGIAQRDPATLTGEAQTREALHVVTGQVQNAKNLVLWTTVAVTGGLILILLGFFTVATMRISRSSRREASAIEARQQERERAKEAVNLVEQQLRTVVKNSPLMVFALNRQGEFTLAEGKALDSPGGLPEVLIGQSIFEVYSDLPSMLHGVRDGLEGRPASAQLDVGEFTFEIRYDPIRDLEGAILGVVGVAYDITSLKRAEKDLADSRAQLSAVLDTAGEGIITVDSTGTICYGQPGGPEHLGLSQRRAYRQAPAEPDG